MVDNTKNPNVPGPGGGHRPDPTGQPKSKPLTPDIALQTNVALPANQREAFISDLQDQLHKKFRTRQGVRRARRPALRHLRRQLDHDIRMRSSSKEPMRLNLEVPAGHRVHHQDRRGLHDTVPSTRCSQRCLRLSIRNGKPDKNGSIVVQSLTSSSQTGPEAKLSGDGGHARRERVAISRSASRPASPLADYSGRHPARCGA